MKYNQNHTCYINSDGLEVPSVTTVLSILNKPFLAKWANIMGFKRQKVEDILERKANIGSLVHKMIECFLLNKMYIWTGPPAGKFIMAAFLNSFINWKKNHSVKPLFMEQQMVSSRFGGTIDFYGVVDDKKTILDFKTSKKSYPSMFLQLAAYCIMLEEAGYEVEQVAIINLSEKSFQEKFMNRNQLQHYIDSFEILVEFFHAWFELNKKDGWGSILDK